MKQEDEILQFACDNPKDTTNRRVLSDKLRELEEYDLAKAVEAERSGELLIRELIQISEETKLPLSVNLLWAVFHVLPRLAQRSDLLAAAMRTFQESRLVGPAPIGSPVFSEDEDDDPIWNLGEGSPTTETEEIRLYNTDERNCRDYWDRLARIFQTP